jgi:hypothetical protein
MPEGQANTGTRDETYNIISVVYHALQGAETCQKYLKDASGDDETRSFIEEAQKMQVQLADRGKQLLSSRLQGGGQGSSAFSFGQGEPGASSGQSMGGSEPSGQTGGGAGGASGGNF